MLNAYLAYKTVTGNNILIDQFQIELTRQIIEKYQTDRVMKPKPSNKDQPTRLIDGIFHQKFQQLNLEGLPEEDVTYAR